MNARVNLEVALCVGACWLLAFISGAGMAATDLKSVANERANASPPTDENKPSDRLREREKETRVRYLKPMNAKPLPDEVRTYLQNNGYLIPQHARSDGLNNVAQGRFFRRGQTDWAVLASKKGITSILVFPKGECEGVVSLASTPTAQSTWAEGFQRWLATMEIPHLLQDFEANGEGQLPPIDHEGINDGIETGSIVHYYYQGKWLLLPGCD